MATDAGHASYLADLPRTAINYLDGLEGFLLIHAVVCWRMPCDIEPCVACSSSAILVLAGWLLIGCLEVGQGQESIT